MAELRLENTGKVSGIFEIDLDKGLLSCLHISDGWQTFHIKDVSTAAYQAYRKSDLSQDERWRRFFEYLDDKQVSRLEVAPDGLQGSRRLRSDDLQFDGEISEVNGALNFYLSCWFDVDEVFGTHVVTDENSDWLNVYANYSLADRQVCDTLDLILHREDSRDEELTYRLDPLKSLNNVVLPEFGFPAKAMCNSSINVPSSIKYEMLTHSAAASI